MHLLRNPPRLLFLMVWLAMLNGCKSPMNPDFRWPWSKTANQPAPQTPADIGPVQPEQKADIQLALAIAAERQGRVNDAERMYREVLQVLPQRGDVHHRLALLYSRKGDFQSAYPYYLQALEYHPSDAQLHCDLGYHHYLLHQWAEAESRLRHAIALDPHLTRAHNNLGMVLSRTGREQEALAAFAHAGASQAEASANLALALSLENRLDEARVEFQRALEINPQLETARDGLASLDNLAIPHPPSQPGHPGTVQAGNYIR